MSLLDEYTIDCEKGKHDLCAGVSYRVGLKYECPCSCHTTPSEDAEIDRLELEILYGRKPRP